MTAASLTVPTILFKPPPKSRAFASQFKPNPQFPFPTTIKNPNIIKFSPKSSLKPLAILNPPTDDPDQTPTAGIREIIAGTVETLNQPASFAILLGFLLTSNPDASLAASGGRMGGSCFSSSSSNESSSSYGSYSAPSSNESSSSYGSYSAPSTSDYSSKEDKFTYSYSSSDHSYSSNSDADGAVALGFLILVGIMAVALVVKLMAGFIHWIFTKPWSSASVSLMTASTSTSASMVSSSQSLSAPPAVSFASADVVKAGLIVAGIVGVVLVWHWMKNRNGRVDAEQRSVVAPAKATVVKLQVGLLGMARSLQKDLDKIAKTADTSTSKGLNYVLTETLLALLRHPDFCISTYSSVDFKQNIEDGERLFNQHSIEERGKFDEETLVNVNSRKNRRASTRRSESFSNEYIVVTILVAAKGELKLPAINGSMDLKEALHRLGSVPTSRTLGVEVLWTPQDENDTLWEQELLRDYPLLRPV